MKAKDFFLFSLAFILTSLLTGIFEVVGLRTTLPSLNVVIFVFIALAISFAIAGIIKYATEKII